MSRRVSFSPEPSIDEAKACKKKKKVMTLKIWSYESKLPKGSRFTPASFFRNIGAKVAKALQFVSNRRCSRKVSSSASLARSRSYAAQSLDSHRAEAIEDCIEFLNYSASLQRSNSVTSSG